MFIDRRPKNLRRGAEVLAPTSYKHVTSNEVKPASLCVHNKQLCSSLSFPTDDLDCYFHYFAVQY